MKTTTIKRVSLSKATEQALICKYKSDKSWTCLYENSIEIVFEKVVE